MKVVNLKSMHVYCAFKNIKGLVNNKKVKIDVYNNFAYRNVHDGIKLHCKRIYNEIENGIYTFNDYRRFLLYSYIFKSSIGFGEVTKKSMHEFKKLFTSKILKLDEKIILQVNKEVKYNDIKKFFEVVDGKSMIYRLIMQKAISPLFWLKYNKFFVGTDENDDHLRFRNVCKLFKLIN